MRNRTRGKAKARTSEEHKGEQLAEPVLDLKRRVESLESEGQTLRRKLVALGIDLDAPLPKKRRNIRFTPPGA